MESIHWETYSLEDQLEHKQEDLATYQSRIGNKNINHFSQETARERVEVLSKEVEDLKQEIKFRMEQYL